MTKFWLAILCSLLTAAACGQASAPDQPQEPTTSPPAPEVASPSKEWRAFRNRNYDYTIQIAPDWAINESNLDEVIIFIGRSDGLAGLHILAMSWPRPAEEFVTEMTNFHRRRSKELFQPISRAEILMPAGYRAELFRYRIQTAPKFCVELVSDVLLVAGQRAYALQGAACEDAAPLYMDLIEAMQQSFALPSSQASLDSPTRPWNQP